MVAARAGVSLTTVSLALNGKSERYGLSPRTVQRVMDAAREVNYVPNGLARSLSRRRTNAVGVVFPHLRNDWADQLMDGMYEVLDQHRLVAYIVSHRGDRDREAHELQSLAERRVDGILCNPAAASLDLYRQVCDRGIPLVFFSDTLAELPAVDHAAWDPAEAATSIQHLIDVGCRRLAYLGFDDDRTMAALSRATFERTVRAAGLEVVPEWIVRNPPDRPFDAALARMFARLDRVDRPDGIFAVYDETAVDAVRLLRRLGLEVPRQVCLATLGDSHLLGPDGFGITTTTAPVREEGVEAAKALIRRIERRTAAPVARLIRGGRLVPRASTARSPGPNGP